MGAPNPKKLSSFSGIDLFTTCERKYFYDRILDSPMVEGPALVVGNVYHEAIAECIRRNWSRPHREVAAEYVVKATEALERVKVSAPDLIDEAEVNLRRVQDTLFGPGGLVAETVNGKLEVEQRFFDDRLGYTGVIDLVSTRTPVVNPRGMVTGFIDGRCVVDWKSITSDRRRTERDARLSPQLGLYKSVKKAPWSCFVEIPRDVEKPIQVRVSPHDDRTQETMEVWLRSIRQTMLARGTAMENYRMTERENGLCAPLWCAHYYKCYPTSEPSTGTTEPAKIDSTS